MQSLFQIRSRCESVADILIASPNQTIVRRAAAIRDCPNHLKQAEGSHYIYSERACGVALCPLCSGRYFAKKRPYLDAMPAVMEANPGGFAYFVGMTSPDVEVVELRNQVDRLHAGFKSLLDKSPLRNSSYLRATHVTRSDAGQAHPHLHAFLVLPKALDTARFQQGWVDQVKGARPPDIAHVHHTKDDWQRCAHYLSHDPYRVTDEMIADPAFLQEMAAQVDGVKSLAQGGDFRRLKTKKPTHQLRPGTRFHWNGSGYLQLAA